MVTMALGVAGRESAWGALRRCTGLFAALVTLQDT